MTKWEYTYCPLSDREAIKQLGRLGWEMIAIVQLLPEGYCEAWFKRPIQTD